MTRRDLFRRVAQGLVGAGALCVSTVPAVEALMPLVDVSRPVWWRRRVMTGCPAPPPGYPAHTVTMQETVGLLLESLKEHEVTWPGVTEALTKRLMVHQFGIPWEQIQRHLWKSRQTQDGWLDGWTHHALLVSDVGKP